MNPVRDATSLLDEIAADALEPGYAEAAARAAAVREGSAPEGAGRHEPSVRKRRRALHIGAAVVLALAGFVAALAVSDVRRGAPDAAAARSQLVARVQERTAATDALADEVGSLRTVVSRARDQELASTRDGRQQSEEISQLELVTGAVPVTGPGLRVTVDDAPTTPSSSDNQSQADLGKVQDRDLQLVVNGLWAAGAEAVAVDGYRITARTAIRTAGETILVDFRPVTAPYVIEAIGDPARLRAQFLDGPGGRALSTLNATYGIRFSTESVAKMTLPAAASIGVVRTGGTP